jgi:hypothetical protein
VLRRGRFFFRWGLVFAVGESWDGEEGEIEEERVGRVVIY